MENLPQQNLPFETDAQDILAFEPPSKTFISAVTYPLRAYFALKNFGLENINPARPALFTSYHTIYSATDILFISEVYRTKDVYLRSLTDDFHFYIPRWRDLLLRFGMVRATPETCDKLMEAGENILVFPGGAREAFKHKGEAYQLHWQQRTGFARMAIKHRYPIIPTASIGCDDALDVVLDGKDVMESLLGKFLNYTGIAEQYLRKGEFFPPVVRGLGLSVIPRPERLYFSFGKAIETEEYEGKFENEAARLDLRAKVAQSINQQIEMLKDYRENDQSWSWIRRFLTKL
jgi:1-acyl-sn-glycerol-3-phosphate acyltransferase